ncbi:MAG: serine protease, partial [Candidatus Omnitrophica bacterium]|nr:serine protease [Candidatus Omnitrophota bacterium]
LLSRLESGVSECEFKRWQPGEISDEEAVKWQEWGKSFMDFTEEKFRETLQSETDTVMWGKTLQDTYSQWLEMATNSKSDREIGDLNRFTELLSGHVQALSSELLKSRAATFKPLVRDQSTGVVIRDGYVVTTQSVAKLRGPDDWIRIWSDKEVAYSTGEVVGVDPDTNLAVIRLATQDTGFAPSIETDPQTQPMVGDYVFFFYHPFNQGLAMQSGEITSLYNQLPFFHCAAFHSTNFPTSPGTLGGPIVDLDGRLVGINTIFMGQGNMSEITYALPIGSVLACVEQIIDKGFVERGRLGVFLSEYQCPIGHHTRVSVTQVLPGSPAEQAGIQKGDVIDSINGKSVHCRMELISRLYQSDPDQDVKLSVEREGEAKEFHLKLASYLAQQ